MEKRLILAIALMLIVAIVPSLIFRSRPPVPAAGTPPTRPDSAVGRPGANDTTRSMSPPRDADRLPTIGPTDPRPLGIPSDTVFVESDLYRYGVSTAGGELVMAELLRYRTSRPGGSGLVNLIREQDAFLDHHLVIGPDTLPLSELEFRADREQVGEATALTLTAQRGGLSVVLRYEFRPTTYLFRVAGQINGLGPTGGRLVIGAGTGLRSEEADTVDDYRNHAVVTRARRTESLRFDRVSPLETLELPGPFTWVATKSKYFVGALLATDENTVPWSGVSLRGGARIDKTATHLSAAVVLPVTQTGNFSYDVYLGPQESERLRAIGHDFENVNPYGWILRPVIMPIAGVVVSVLVWMHENLNLAYGWVLILFGFAIRVVLWPLNQKAMESNMRMQAAQPYMKEVQEKHKGNPQRLQEEMLKVYKEHGVNPVGGCLPMLIPMPVLFALFFVFANTIEFRGVPFLWLPDLSRADPLYIIPVLMGASMFALMKLGQRGVPPTPQTKIMVYFMPAFMMIVLWRFASGLNLYYAAQNLFSLPQQWLISNKRLAQQPGSKG